MPSFTNCIVLLVLAVSASASSTPAFAHRRQAMAVRNAGPVVHHHAPIVRDVEPVKRQMQRRSCKSRTSSSSAAATTSPAPAAVGKLGGAGDTSTSESAKTTATKEATSTKAEATSTKAEATSTKAETSSSKTSSSAKSTSTGGGSAGSFLAGVNTGQGTFFGTGLGACGITNSASDKIVAVSELLFDSYPGYDGANPNKNPVCGKKITATYGGKTVDVTVTDRCVACKMTDLDFTTSAFDLIADAALGRISGMTWKWA